MESSFPPSPLAHFSGFEVVQYLALFSVVWPLNVRNAFFSQKPFYSAETFVFHERWFGPFFFTRINPFPAASFILLFSTSLALGTLLFRVGPIFAFNIRGRLPVFCPDFPACSPGLISVRAVRFFPFFFLPNFERLFLTDPGNFHRAVAFLYAIFSPLPSPFVLSAFHSFFCVSPQQASFSSERLISSTWIPRHPLRSAHATFSFIAKGPWPFLLCFFSTPPLFFFPKSPPCLEALFRNPFSPLPRRPLLVW